MAANVTMNTDEEKLAKIRVRLPITLNNEIIFRREIRMKMFYTNFIYKYKLYDFNFRMEYKFMSKQIVFICLLTKGITLKNVVSATTRV